MKKKIDLSFYLVTRSIPLASLENIVRQAVEGGVTIVQLRGKDISARQMIAEGRMLLSILRPLGIPLIVNDRVDIAYALQADGVHLGQSDVPVQVARSILGREAIIGLSVETWEHALQAENEEVDYLGASPVFSTMSKHDCAPPLGLEKLQKICSFSSHPIVAIGGINGSTISEAGNCGVEGFALMSAIFDAANPKQAAQGLSSQIRQSLKARSKSHKE